MKSDFDTYKSCIDLVAFAEQVYGYRVNRKKSTRREVVMEDAAGTEVLVISRHAVSGHSIYFNPQDEQDSGTVIDFSYVRNQHNWKKVRAELASYVQGTGLETQGLPPDVAASPVMPNFSLLPFTDRAYLHARGITDATIDDPVFEQRIFNHVFSTETGQTYLNTAFPLYRSGEIVGLELKNVGYHGNAAGSARAAAFWTSATDGLAAPIDAVIVTESAIDALSYHQLFPPAAEARLYVSMSGYIAKGQRALFLALVQELAPRRIVLANDNDLPGRHHNLNLIGWLETELARSRRLRAASYVPAPGQACLTIDLDLSGGFQLLLPAVRQLFLTHNEALAQAGEPLFVVDETRPDSDARPRLEVRCPDLPDYLERLEHCLLHLKGLQERVEIARAVGKDFNEDLLAD